MEENKYGEEYNFPTGHYTPESWLDGQTSVPVSGTVDGYYYSINSEETPVTVTVDNERIYNMLFNNVEWQTGASYWLASRGVFAFSVGATFGSGLVNEGGGLICRYRLYVQLWRWRERWLRGGAPRSCSEV